MEKEDLHILRLMGEIHRDGNYSQRELSRRLNLSLGLVNTFLKRLVNKGYFKVKAMPKNRMKYLLTPQGLARKSKLTVDYLRYSVNFYKDIKHLLLNKYKEMEKNNIKFILFHGAGEIAELAYLYLQLTNIRLVGIVDEKHNDKNFFGFKVCDCDRIEQKDWDCILLTCLEDTDQDIQNLFERGIDPEKIVTI